jgi:hypothetical protein
MKTVQSSLITDAQALVSATYRLGPSIHTYDDGFGPLFIHRDSIGISGIVRARTWEDAYSICEDEFFPEASETVEELRAEYNFKQENIEIIRTIDGIERPAVASDYPQTTNPAPGGRKNWEFVRWQTVETPCTDENGWTENELFCESYGFRPSGRRSMKNGKGRDPIGHGIYAKDLNGDSLDVLTPELLAELEITLEIVTNE